MITIFSASHNIVYVSNNRLIFKRISNKRGWSNVQINI